MTNVFNSFNFNKWAESRKEEEIDEESRKRRALQIKRLKERLIYERKLREAGGDGDLDLEALIEALQRGDDINSDEGINLFAEGGDGGTGYGGGRSDDDILTEVRRYQNEHSGRPGTAGGNDVRFWKYNRLYKQEEDAAVTTPPRPKSRAPPAPRPGTPQQKDVNFKYNRFVTK